MLKKTTLFIALLIISLPLPAAFAGWDGRLKIDPAVIEATTFYSGATVEISAEVPEGYKLAVVCNGRGAPVELNRKGKVLGALWMNVGDVSFERVPVMYQLQTSDRLDKLASQDVLNRLQIGYPALLTGSSAKEVSSDAESIFGELIKLREREGLFSMDEGTLKTSTESSGGSHLETTVRVPAKAPPGDYRVRVLGFKDGRGELLAAGKLKITQVGTAAFISSLAQQHGLLYGILAAVIAVVVGLLTGIVFGLGSKGGH